LVSLRSADGIHGCARRGEPPTGETSGAATGRCAARPGSGAVGMRMVQRAGRPRPPLLAIDKIVSERLYRTPAPPPTRRPAPRTNELDAGRFRAGWYFPPGERIGRTRPGAGSGPRRSRSPAFRVAAVTGARDPPVTSAGGAGRPQDQSLLTRLTRAGTRLLAGHLVDGWSRHLGVCRGIQYGQTAMRGNRQQQGTKVFLALAVVLVSLWTGGLAASSAGNPADYLAASRAQLGIQPAALRNPAPALRPAAERPGPRGRLVPLLLATLAAALAGACRWRAAAQRPGLARPGSRACSTPLEARAPPHLQPA
jgi:hypothetical protein